MGWLEFQGHLAAHGRLCARKAGRDRTDPDSWQGYEQDSWWEGQRREADRLRGR